MTNIHKPGGHDLARENLPGSWIEDNFKMGVTYEEVLLALQSKNSKVDFTRETFDKIKELLFIYKNESGNLFFIEKNTGKPLDIESFYGALYGLWLTDNSRKFLQFGVNRGRADGNNGDSLGLFIVKKPITDQDSTLTQLKDDLNK